MIKNFHNFVYESKNIDFYTIDVRNLYNTGIDNVEIIKTELDRRLKGKEIRISELYYDEKKNLFYWKPITTKFTPFNGVEKIDDKHYIVFDRDCMIKLKKGLSIDYRFLYYGV